MAVGAVVVADEVVEAVVVDEVVVGAVVVDAVVGAVVETRAGHNRRVEDVCIDPGAPALQLSPSGFVTEAEQIRI